MSLALNCNTNGGEDVEVISNLIRIRLKTKPLANHYVNCIKYVYIAIYIICKNKYSYHKAPKQYIYTFKFKCTLQL